MVLAYPLHGQDHATPLFAFGLIADVQYADADAMGKRDYRSSLKRLENCVEIFNQHDLAFIIHAGDLIDRDYASFRFPLSIFGKSTAPVHYVVGNHEFAIADSLKKNVRKLLNNPRGYYSFVQNNFQFILVDAMDVSLMSSTNGSRGYRKALSIQERLKEEHANNAHEWNGAIGRNQQRWLKRKLRRGESRGYNTLIFSHHPLLPENGLQVWNSSEILTLIAGFPRVRAFISGHHHPGGYVQKDGVHHVTLKGLVEAKSEGALGIAEVFPDKLVINGFGDQPGYTLRFE